MSANGNRLNSLDTDSIKSSKPGSLGTMLENKLVGADTFNNSNPVDYIQRADLSSAVDEILAGYVGMIKIAYTDLQPDHKTYVNPDLFGQTEYQLFQNGISRFLEEGSEFVINPDGGFELTYELNPGDSLFLMGSIDGLVNGPNLEVIEFSGADGILSIDMTMNARQQIYLFPSITVYNVVGSQEIKVIGYTETTTRAAGSIVSIELDGIFADGYILLTNI